MSIHESLQSFFKPEIQTSGSKIFDQSKVVLSSSSDTSIEAYVKSSPPLKVQLSSADISSKSFSAFCTCPAGKKERLCKHIWATLCAVEQMQPDFLNEKQTIEILGNIKTTSQNSFQESTRLKQAQYRKEQYQKQKLRAKEVRQERSKPVSTEESDINFPPEIKAAIHYFSENGFSMLPYPTETLLGDAKRKLSRIYHPDRGGSHEEITELNKNWELVAIFLRKSGKG